MKGKEITPKRLDILRRQMEREKLDGFLVSSPQNRYYFSGFTGDYGFLLVTETRNILFLDSRFLEQAKEECRGWEVIQFQRFHQDFSSLLSEIRVRFLGFESQKLSFFDFKELERNSPGVHFVPFPHLLEEIRGIKEPGEILKIREAIRIAEESLGEVLKGGLIGNREEEVSLELEWKMRLKGAQKAGFDLVVASGKRSALPHGVASPKAIGKKEFLLFDWGALKDYYHSDITRTFFTGSPSKKQREVYLTVKEAIEETILQITPGRSILEVFQFALSKIKNSPFKDFAFGHGLGHGVGLEVHEWPFIGPRSEGTFQPGMVFTIEPGIYIPGWGGVRIEEMVMVAKNRVEVLTSFPREISVI
ncbi:MAG: Xaa-Pro peptidase family protein [Caldiserica bacterium]|jgi:Xaa-Pro aminopeptidase|nr:Xaa-Pro peptidase family protein [Caldisericota bacterium]MDH7562939.1 Xaa-Pro peptidase family protein [Caldisericota bacterium]